jgi:hypothetical protein
VSSDGTPQQSKQRTKWAVVLAAVSATANVLRLVREFLTHQ